LADFGLTSEGTSHSLHNTEFARGTPGYRAPELLKEDSAAYNNKVDIWALGCILYELVVGTKPFATDVSVLGHYRTKSSIEFDVDESFDAESRTVLTEVIAEMLQEDPSLRPSATTLLSRFSVYGTIAKAPSMQVLPNAKSPKGVFELHPSKVSDRLPVWRKRHVLDRTESLPADPVRTASDHSCTVFFTTVNISNERMITVSCDAVRKFSQVKLWDTSSGQCLWERKYIWEGVQSRANPTFSDDGNYFGIQNHEKTVDVFDTDSQEKLRSAVIESAGRITAIAVSKHMHVAIAVDKGSPVAPIAEDTFAELNDIGPGINSTVDVVAIHGMSGVSLAYDHSDRYLRLVGLSRMREQSGNMVNAQVAFSWDTILRGNPTIYQPQFSTGISDSASPLYNLPCNDLSFFRGFYSFGKPHICLATSSAFYGAMLRCADFTVFGVNRRSILVLTDEEYVQIWDIKKNMWVRNENRQRVDSSDPTVYNFLVKCEGKGLVGGKGHLQVTILAKIVWDDYMPRLSEVRGVAETEAGLMLMLENEDFIFVGL
jgi:WD40 repeat protein